MTFESIATGFSSQSTFACKLSILLGMDSFAYSIMDGHGKIQFVRECAFTDERNMHQAIQDDDLLGLSYKYTQLALASSPHTLIPRRLFQADSAAVYLNQLTALEEGDEVLINEMEGTKMVCLFSMPAAVKEALQPLRQIDRKTHLAYTLVEEVHRQTGTPEISLHMHMVGHTIWLVGLEGGKLKCANSYRIHSAQEVLYYVMLVYHHLQLDPLTQPLHLSGRIAADSNLVRVLEAHVSKLVFTQRQPRVKLAAELEAIPDHWYQALFHMGLREE